MSWVVEEWKEGLPTKSLQKINELESQLDKLKKDRQQRQLQLESLEAAFQKQKQKVESEKGEVTALKRENQSLIELCDGQEKSRQKLSHDQQVKDTQINFLEGQLSANKKHIEKLEQELKRYKNDLERSQQSFNAADMSVCVTPQKSVTVSFTPITVNDTKYEVLQEKYNKEVEERKRLETELKILQIKIVNQSSQPASQNTMNHRDIARHQSSSSVFSWQQERTPSRASSSSHDTSLKRSFPASQSPWEQEETPHKRGFKSDNSNRSFSESSNNAANEQLKNQNQELRSKVNELELRLQVQEKELKNQLNKLQETQTLLEKTRTELVEKDRALGKSRDDVARVTLQFEQSVDKGTLTEQKLKKVSEELSCQRQNAESARLTLEHKLKEREKENQQELIRQQNSLKNVEQQLSQMKTKLSQESQQAKNEFNAIQSELDRATHGKKILESEVEELKQKLHRAEQAVCANESHVNDFKRNLEEAKSQQNAIKSQLDQKCKEALKVEEEFSTANQTIRQNQLFMDELKNKNNSLEVELKTALQKLKGQDSTSLQNLNVTILNLEKERDSAQELLRKREGVMEETKNTLAQTAEELQVLKNQLDCKARECKELINTNISLSSWKNEHVTNTFCKEREEMSARIKDLEMAIQTCTDQINLLENDKKNLHTQIKALQDITDVKTADLDVQKGTCTNLQQQLETENQKYRKEMENLTNKISELEAERKLQESNGSSSQISYLESELETQRKLSAELKSQHEKLLESQVDVHRQLLQMEETHERLVSDSRSHVELLQDTISTKQHYLDSVIEEKDEEISTLAEKLRLTNADMQSAYQNNKELNDKLQELNLLSESWSTEREKLIALISSNQRNIEKLTEENLQVRELSNPLSDEKTQLQDTNIDLSHAVEKQERDVSEMEEEGAVDGDSDEMNSQYENLKQEMAEWKENLCKTDKETSHLLRVNEEMSALVGQLRNSERSLNNIIEDLRVCLQDKNLNLTNLQAKLELLEMDRDDKQIPVESINEPVNNPQSASNDGVEGDNLHLIKKPLSPEEKENVPCGVDQIIMMGDGDAVSVDNDSSPLVDLREVGSQPPSIQPQNRDENETLLINLDLLTLTSGDATIILPVLPELNQTQCQAPTTLSPIDSPGVKETSAGGRCETKADRKSLSSELVDLLLQQTPEQQHVLFSGIENENTCDLKDVVTFYRMELSNLQKQHLSDIATWQQKLNDQALEMETKLAAEKAQTDRLSQELEAARVELHILDLSARSLLFDCDDSTTRFDTTNQSICTFLPLGRLSLGNTDLRRSENLNYGQQSPHVKNASEKTDVDIIETVSNGNLTEEEEKAETPSRGKQRRKGDASKVHVDNPEIQPVSESPQPNSPESINEHQKLLKLIKERDQINQTLVLEIKCLSTQIDMQRSELLGKETENQELGNKSKELQTERLQLLEKIELISNEKLQSRSRTVDLEKELHNTLSTMEILKAQISELSGLHESLEITNREWKENYLQTESELRRIKSEKANIEAHALSLEADLDALQSKCQRLQEESEGRSRSFNDLQENLNAVVTEKHQLNQELENLVEQKEELDQMYKKLKEREVELQSSKLSSKELIKILEADIRALKEELQTAKSTVEQLTAERDLTAQLQENEKKQIQEEKQLLLSAQEALQMRLSAAHEEKDKLSSALECCQSEKRELANRLNSAQEEVALMRTGIEKLKVKIESDEKKKRQIIEKLKESERKFDNLKDKIETLERELVMAEENLENAILQTETAKEEAEELNSQKETLQAELKSLRRKLVHLEEEHQNSQEKMVELEGTIVTVRNTLENREIEHAQFRKNSEEQQELLETQMEELRAQKAHSDQRYETALAEHADVTTKAEQLKAQLLQQLEEVQTVSSDLKLSVEQLTLELEECKHQLSEKTLQLNALESDEENKRQTIEKLKDTERKCDHLNDKIETLERELVMAEESLENAILQTETAKEEAEELKSQKETLQAEFNSLSRKLVDLEEEHQNSQDKVVELEETVVTIKHSLEKRDIEHTQFRSNSEEQHELLQTQLEELRAQKDLSDQRYETALDEHADVTTKAEQLKAQLLQQLEEVQTVSSDLKLSVEQLTLELEECKHQLSEKTLQLNALESDEENKRQTIEKLKDTERKCDHLNDKIETLERELVMAEESLENAILQTETAKEEAEELKSQKETLQAEFNSLMTKLVDLEKEHQNSQDKVVELEETIVTVRHTLEKRDIEHTQFRKSSEEQHELLQTQLEELRAQKAFYDQRYETALAEHADATTNAEQLEAQLLKQLVEVQMFNSDLKLSVEQLTLKLEECKHQLSEKTLQLVALETLCKEAEQWEMKYSTEMSRFEVEQEKLRNENKSLQTALEELEAKGQTISAENDSVQATIADLKTSHNDLEAQIQVANYEKQALLRKVAELDENRSSLQSKLQDADLHIKTIQEQNCNERRCLDEEMRATRQQHEDGRALLLAATSERQETITRLQESQAQKQKDDITEYEKRLLQADSRHQSLVDEIMKLHKGDRDRYQEQLTSVESHLNAHKQEIDSLKGSNGELIESLCRAREQLAELNRLKADLDRVKEENAATCKNRNHWMNSCKQLKQEKEKLQKHIVQQEETIQGFKQRHENTEMNTSGNDILSEMEELKQCLEEKTQEADESVEKYCNLMIKTHKLEDANDTLSKQVHLLSQRLRESETKREVESPSLTDNPLNEGARRGGKSKRSTPGSGKQSTKRQRESEGAAPTPTAPQLVAKRVKKTGTRSTEEEEKFEPEGLPDVVKRGFGDIPSGKRSPFILRRAAAPIRKSPRLASQTNSPSIDHLENLADLSSPAAGGSKSQMTKATEAAQRGPDLAPMDVSSPLSAHNKRRSRTSQHASPGKTETRASVTTLQDQSEEEGNCQVQ